MRKKFAINAKCATTFGTDFSNFQQSSKFVVYFKCFTFFIAGNGWGKEEGWEPPRKGD